MRRRATLAVIDRVDHPAVVDAVVLAVRAEVPAYETLVREGLAAPLREAVRIGCEIEFAVLAECRGVTPRERGDLEDACRDLAFWGLTPEDLLTAFDVAGPLIWERLIAAARPDELPDLLGAGRHLFSMTETIRAVHAALAREDFQGMPAEESDARHLLRSAAAGLADVDARDAQARLGLVAADLPRPFVLVQHSGGAPSRGHLARRLRREGVLAATQPDRIVGLAPAGPWSVAQPAGATIVLADPGVDPLTPALWDELLDAAAVAHARGRRGPVELHEMAVECMLLAAPSTRRRLREVVERLRAPAAPGKVDLLGTASAALAGDLVRSRIAELLEVHPSTARYRIERLEETLGLRLRRPAHRAVLALALRTASLPEQPEDRPSSPRSARPGTGRVVARLAARLDHDAVVERLVSALRSGVPGFADRSSFDDAALRHEARAFVRAVLAPDRAEHDDVVVPDAAGSLVEGRLRRGVRREDGLRALSVSGQLVWDALLAEATPTETPYLPAIAVRLMRLANPGALVAHRPAGAVASAATAEASAFIVELLAAGSTGPAQVRALARTWGLDPLRPSRPTVVVPTAEDGAPRLAAAMRSSGWLAAVHRDLVLAFVPAEVEPDRLPASVRLVALGSPGPLAGLSRSVADVLLLADVARRRGATGVVTHTEWEADLLVAANPVTSQRLRRRILEQLERSDRRASNDLAATMFRHLEHDLDRARTSRAMHLHPNSLDHRLRAITARTGLSFSRTDDVLTMTLVAATEADRTR